MPIIIIIIIEITSKKGFRDQPVKIAKEQYIYCKTLLQGCNVYVIDNHFMTTIVKDYTVELWISMSIIIG